MWHWYRAAKVDLVELEDGTFSPSSVIVWRRSGSGMGEESREIPLASRQRRFKSRDEAAEAALESLRH